MSEGGAVKLTGFTDETMRMLVGYLPVHTTEQHANGDTVVVTLLAAENLKRLLTGLPDSAFPIMLGAHDRVDRVAQHHEWHERTGTDG